MWKRAQNNDFRFLVLIFIPGAKIQNIGPILRKCHSSGSAAHQLRWLLSRRAIEPLNYIPFSFYSQAVEPLMHLAMSRGEEAGHRVGFWHFPKHCCQIPYPRAKMWGRIYWNSPPQEMICGHGHKQKFKCPYSKIIQMPYPRAKAIDQIPALCPVSSPAGLTLIGA